MLRTASLCGLLIVGVLHVAIQNAGAVQFSISDRATFTNLINTNAVFTTNVTYNYQIEGPVWIPNGQYLVFSDMANNRLEKLVPSNTLSIFFQPALAKTIYNGNFLDLQERQLSCLCGSNGLAVAMTTNGVATTLVTTCNGLKFYSPNDLCVKSDGSIWFTNPGYNSGISLPPPTGPGRPPGFQRVCTCIVFTKPTPAPPFRWSPQMWQCPTASAFRRMKPSSMSPTTAPTAAREW